MNNDIEDIIETLKKYEQRDLLKYINDLSNEEKDKLINEIKNIDFDLLNKIYVNALKECEISPNQITPIKYFCKKELNQDYYRNIGEKILRDNKLAVITLAGGMGSRLGLSKAKGTIEVTINDKNVSLFEVICNKLKKASKKYSSKINWYIMTSKRNDKLTKEYFEKNNYFDYPKENVFFFTQDTDYVLDVNGKLMLEDKGIIKKDSNGNGDVYRAFKSAGLNKTLDNVDYIVVSGIDNILLDIIDPVFIGLTCDNNLDIASKSIAKEDLDNSDWVFARVDDEPHIIKPSYLTGEMRYKKDKEGKYEFNQFNILCHIYKKNVFIECEDISLPYHAAFRKTNYLDEKGDIIEATSPNSYKFEKFIYDAFAYYKNFALLEVERDREFSPIKEKEDVKKAVDLYIKNKY